MDNTYIMDYARTLEYLKTILKYIEKVLKKEEPMTFDFEIQLDAFVTAVNTLQDVLKREIIYDFMNQGVK